MICKGVPGNSHLNQINNRYKHPDDVPLTLEKLSGYTGYKLEHLCEIYEKVCKKKYPVLVKVPTEPSKPSEVSEQPKPKDKEEEELKKFCEDAQKKGSRVKLPQKTGKKMEIKGFSTKNKTLLKGLKVKDEVKKIEKRLEPIPEAKAYSLREFDEKGIIACYAFANRLDRYKGGTIKTLPSPVKIARLYINDAPVKKKQKHESRPENSSEK